MQEPENRYLVVSHLAALQPSSVLDAASLQKYTPEAATSLQDLAAIICALDGAEQTAAVRSLREKSLSEVSEGWTTITRWINYLIAQASQTTHDIESNIIQLCINVLAIACGGAHTHPCKADMASHSSTAELVYRLLQLKDHRGGKYFTLHPVGGPCKIAGLVAILRQAEQGWTSMLYTLKCMKTASKKDVITAFISRISEAAMNAHGEGSHGAMRTLLNFITNVLLLCEDTGLFREFKRQHFMAKISSSLCEMARKAEMHGTFDRESWEYLGACIVELLKASTVILPARPAATLLPLLNGGILTCAAVCLPHLMNSPEGNLVSALELILPFLYLSKIGDAVSKSEELHAWAVPLQRLETGKLDISSLREEYAVCFDLTRHAFLKRGDTSLNLCSNLWVSGPFAI